MCVISDEFVKCVTTGGKSGPGIKCQIPFIWKGVEYWGCPKDPYVSTETWCSTKVDRNRNHIIGQNQYGFCSSSCPKHDEN